MAGQLFVTPRAALNHLLAPIDGNNNDLQNHEPHQNEEVNRDRVLDIARGIIRERQAELGKLERQVDHNPDRIREVHRVIGILLERQFFIEEYCRNPQDVRRRV